MEVAKGKEAIDRHLAAMLPLIEEGGFKLFMSKKAIKKLYFN